MHDVSDLDTSVVQTVIFDYLFAHRCISAAHQRASQGNYSLNGLVGFEMYKKTVGVIGTGAIGIEAVRILKVCEMLNRNEYVWLPVLFGWQNHAPINVIIGGLRGY